MKWHHLPFVLQSIGHSIDRSASFHFDQIAIKTLPKCQQQLEGIIGLAGCITLDTFYFPTYVRYWHDGQMPDIGRQNRVCGG